jgi:hypothetical protein
MGVLEHLMQTINVLASLLDHLRASEISQLERAAPLSSPPST